MPGLIILDISFNEINNDVNSRLQILYNVPHVKVLNGLNIDKQDIKMAKELFSGRLT